MTLGAFLTWSKGSIKPEDIWSNLPFPRNTHVGINILTVTVSVHMKRNIHTSTVPDFSGLMDGRLSSWIDTAKEHKPDKIVLLLLVQGVENFLPWVMNGSAPAAQASDVQMVYDRVMDFLRLFAGIQTSLAKEYLMVWDSPRFEQNVLGALAKRFPPSDRVDMRDTMFYDMEGWYRDGGYHGVGI